MEYLQSKNATLNILTLKEYDNLFNKLKETTNTFLIKYFINFNENGNFNNIFK